LGNLEKRRGNAIGDEFESSLEDLSTRIAALERQLELLEDSSLDRKVLAESVAVLEARLLQVENSLVFRFNRAFGNFMRSHGRKLAWALRYPPLDFLRRSQVRTADEQYARWAMLQEASLASVEWYRERAARWTYSPRIGILMITQNPKREWLTSAIASVQSQSYGNWQLCICDDASTESWVTEYLSSLAKSDFRIKVTVSPSLRGVSTSLNAAARLGDSDYVAVLPQNGTLHPHCLYHVGEACQKGLQVIYVDEDHLDDSGRRRRPSFKPSWSPDLLTSCMYWGRFWVVKRECVEGVAPAPACWFRSGFEGAEEYDLALRLTDTPLNIGHISRVLFHSRSWNAPYGKSPSEVRESSRRALEDALHRRGYEGNVEYSSATNTFVFHREVQERPLISIVVCSRNLKLFEPFLHRLAETTDYDNLELVLVEHQMGLENFPLNRLRAAWKKPLTRIPFVAAFNFSDMNNRGAQAAQGKILVFLNDDVEPIHKDWLARIVGQVQRPEVGVVGTLLEYPSGAIQHAGIAVGMSLDGTGHPGRFLFHSDLFPWLRVTRNVTAVTGACFAIRKSVYEELAGMDPQFPVDYNDVDLCLRARERGYLVVYEAAAVLRHRESASRGVGGHFRERGRFQRRWGNLLEQPDPYMPAAIDRKTEAIRLALGQNPWTPMEGGDETGAQE
jgi:glycosyltransferase involved in cell wall biosynthesis